jgi:hypothetical protein
MTMDEFRLYYLKYHLQELSPEERMAGLPPEERLQGLSVQEIEAYLKRLRGDSPSPAADGNEASP